MRILPSRQQCQPVDVGPWLSDPTVSQRGSRRQSGPSSRRPNTATSSCGRSTEVRVVRHGRPLHRACRHDARANWRYRMMRWRLPRLRHHILPRQDVICRLRSRRSASATSSGLARSPGCTPSASARARTVRVDGAVRPLSRRVIVSAWTPERRASSACDRKCSRRRRRSVSLNAIWTPDTHMNYVLALHVNACSLFHRR